ncbi:MAG: AGE family epimerase/isomerase [Planctomycetaceae bacterium]|nr:AGE family epimerase/isomerase [Planctomycetaceae bacterium]
MNANHLANFYRDQLLNDCLPFWFPRCIDEQHGGYLHCLDRDGSVVDTDKSVWAQGRMAWMLLTLYLQVEQRDDWLAWGTSGLDFLDQYGFAEDGRMYFHVTRDGQPIRQRRYAYSESFAAIAFAAHARATGNERFGVRARELFAQFIDWNFTPGKMPAKFTDTRPTIGMGPRMIALVTAQELRSLLGPDAFTDQWTDRSLSDIEQLFVKPELKCVMEQVGPDGEVLDHFDTRLLNPGHAIEGAWFVMEEGRHRGDQHLIALGCQMLDWMWERGWDQEHGGLYYFRDVYDRPVQEYWHPMKFWWPHDEALIATLLAWRLTGESRYAQWHEQLRAWSFEHFADPEHGEWYGYLHQDGRPSSTLKGSLWKSCFHHPRALLKCWELALECAAEQ